MNLRHVAMVLGLFVVIAWVSAHLVLLAPALGLGVGYFVGRASGRRKAVLDAAQEIVISHARTLGEGGAWR
jgi:hypothetical protein